MLQRFELMNHVIQKYYRGDCNYLEIGVAYPEYCFNRIDASHKTSVDPRDMDKKNPINYVMTSDEFFYKLEAGKTEFEPEKKWDVIFIDGLHLAPQVYKDAKNALNHITENGFIFFHDCSPEKWFNAHSDHDYFQENPHGWNGSTWKAFYKLRTELKMKTYTIDSDHGVGVIEVGKSGEPIEFINTWFEYGEFKNNRKNDIGLISEFEFLRMHT